MADVVNLRTARKRKRRAEKERAAQANRLTHGSTPAAKDADRLNLRLERLRLEQHRREAPHDSDDGG